MIDDLKKETSTSINNSVIDSNTRTEDNSTSSYNNNKNQQEMYYGLFKQFSNEQTENSLRINSLENEVNQLKNNLNENAKLAKTARISLILLMLVPMIQVIVCAAIIFGLGKEEQLPNLLKWFMSGISIMSVLEIIACFTDLKQFKDRIDNIENKIKSTTTQ